MKTRILHKPIIFTALIVLLCLSSSCSFFRVVTESQYTSQSIKQYEDEGKYLILQRGDEAWHLYDLQITNDSIYAMLDHQIGYHLNYLNPKDKGLNRFKKKYEPEVINAVHLYTSDTSFSSFDTIVSIPVSSIDTIKSYAYARAASRASKIVPAVILPVAGLIIIAGVAISQMSFSGIY
ncbi:MAG: hypothetical protein KAT76_04855 [Bacteroidales bacterium]|nr:hypothetical protein [Bacteroidales bacterium]